MMLPTIHFNLRQPKAIEPTNIYCVVYVGGKQIKFATSVKVKPKQWNKKKQLAIVSNVHNIVDNYNNNIVNKKISVMLQQFNRYLEYLCTTNNIDKPIHYFFMEQKTKINFIDEIIKADIVLNKDITKEKTLAQHKTKLNAYTDYLTECKPKDAFTQKGFDDYVQYLEDKGQSNLNINGKAFYVRQLLNDIIRVNPQIYYKTKKNNRKEKGRFPLYDDEIKAIEQLKIDDNKVYKTINIKDENNKRNIMGSTLKLYRDMFVLQCECGQRVSDLLQILKGECKTTKYYDYDFIELKTKKTNQDAFILVDDKIRTLANRIKSACTNKETNKIDLPSEKYYNDALKIIAKEANLKRIIEYTDTQQKEQRKHVYEKLSSHCARHTYITKLVLLGIPKPTIILITGHRDIKIIDDVYLHLSKEDKFKQIIEGFGKNKIENKEQTKPKKVDIFNALFAFDKLKQVKDLLDNDIINRDLYDKAAITIRDITLLDKAKSVYDDDKSKYGNKMQLKLNAKVKEIGKILFPLCQLFKDVETYQYFEYKAKVLNVIEKVTDEEILCQQMDVL